jgi:hypothetical protein
MDEKGAQSVAMRAQVSNFHFRVMSRCFGKNCCYNCLYLASRSSTTHVILFSAGRGYDFM